MSSLKKRATVGMVISVVFLVAGIALLYFGHDSFNHVFKNAFVDIEKISDEGLVIRMLAGSLPVMAGGVLTSVGFLLFPIFLSMWIRNPPPGSKLTFRGWKTPEEYGEKAIAAGKAWQAVVYGIWGGLTWIGAIWLGLFSLARTHPKVTTPILVFILIECSALYGAGIFLCRRRDCRTTASAAKWPWTLALVLNYGGLFAFLCFIGALLVLRTRS